MTFTERTQELYSRSGTTFNRTNHVQSERQEKKALLNDLRQIALNANKRRHKNR